jgi:hypothetical protein
MSEGVEFEEDAFATKKYQQFAHPTSGIAPANMTAVERLQVSKEARGISGWLIRHHLAKDFEGAQKILLIVVLLNIVITVVVAIFFL